MSTYPAHRQRRPNFRSLSGMMASPLLALLSVACGSTAEHTDPSPSPTASGSSTAPPSSADASPAGTTQFRVVIGDTELTGRLFDNAAARDFASQLPLTLTFRDLNSQEKISPLPRKLSLDGMPVGDDPDVGELGYWAPDGNLVLYYGDVGYWTGISRLGEIDGDMHAVAEQSSDFTATIELTD
jgi:hypothetical protein